MENGKFPSEYLNLPLEHGHLPQDDRGFPMEIWQIPAKN
jgi:hypothetical protein